MSARTRALTMLESWLEHPRLPIHLAALAILLALPALGIGWQLDGHFDRLTMVDREAVDVHPLDVSAGLRDGPEDLRGYNLSAASMWLDDRLWPDAPVLMHLHSLAWYGFLIAVATLLYRRLLGAGWWAGLAALLYAVDDAHVVPAAWLATRSALLATAFGILSLWSFDLARRCGSRRAAVMSPVWLGVALCAGEAAVAAVGYLLAYALFLDPTRWRRRGMALAPHLAIVVVWAAAYRLLGFGAQEFDQCLDPVGRPAAFAAALATRAPVLLLGQWTPVPADWAIMVRPDPYLVFLVAGLVVIGLLGFLLAPLLCARARARFWLVGMLLSLVPASTGATANGLLLFAGLGAMGLLAELIRGLCQGHAWVPRQRAWLLPARGLVATLAGTHLALAPAMSLFLPCTMKPVGDPIAQAIAAVPDDARMARTGVPRVLASRRGSSPSDTNSPSSA